ncbi:hypothetical protein SAMN05421676_10293 [Salinibacillus kushneri]|uniref:Uncharacterized protein n=1 Tax=Salinibacillus kushneri TaxID=237682 RepID=A0A1I0AAJ1_9BACI|nr:hypothetical protein [Salinibacillus kushneri]SES91186.1 hypothetical protein SAMN05421676_10293 [Salinibacillus kushneri]
MYSEKAIPDLSPQPFVEWFFNIVLGVPFVAMLIWSIINPKESYLFGMRWMFKKEPDIYEKMSFFGFAFPHPLF